jgi:hypothetical protein
MKKIKVRKLLISLMVIPFILVSCEEDLLPGISGRGDVVTRTLNLDDFTGFANAIAADIYVQQGDEQEVTIKAQENIIENIDLNHVYGGFWTIEFDRLVRRAEPVKIYITVPTLDRVKISGAGEIFGESSFSNLSDLELVISGAGNMDLDFDCENLDVAVSGAGQLDLSGSANTLKAVISGAGGIRAFDLSTTDTEFRISGAGSGRLTVSDYLKATITGSGNLYYRGDPETDVHITGSGKVMKDH